MANLFTGMLFNNCYFWCRSRYRWIVQRESTSGKFSRPQKRAFSRGCDFQSVWRMYLGILQELLQRKCFLGNCVDVNPETDIHIRYEFSHNVFFGFCVARIMLLGAILVLLLCGGFKQLDSVFAISKK